jgi:DNA-binding transcriptional MerR regulator
LGTARFCSELNVGAAEHFASHGKGMELFHLKGGQLMNVAARGFPTHLASQVAGVTPRTLLNWCCRGFLKPSVSQGRTGPGGERVYSFRDLVAIRVADDLRSRGIDVRHLRLVVDYVRKREGLELDQAVAADAILVSDGRTFREVQCTASFMEIRQGGTYSILLIPFGELVNELQTKARALGLCAA